MKAARGGKLLFAGIVAVLIGGFSAGATQRQWVAPQAAPDRNWSQATNWSGSTAPGTADEAYFSTVAGPWYLYHPIWLDVNPTISNLYLHGGAGGNATFIFSNAAARITMTNLIYDWTWQYPVTMHPSVTVNGPFVATRALPGNAGPGVFTLTSSSGNVFNGGINVGWHKIVISGTGNTFKGLLKVSGWQEGVPTGGKWDNGQGELDITGTGNTFGPGQFHLDYRGVLYLPKQADYSSISSIMWSGGALRLGGDGDSPANTFPPYATGFNVARGSLWAARESVLGATANNKIQLGSKGGYGELRGGGNSDTVGIRFDRAITLNGNGGIFWPHYSSGNYNANMLTTAPIDGTGELIQMGFYWQYLNGTDTTVNASTYSGGTRLVGRDTQIREYRSLGTGNVIIDCGNNLHFYSSTNVAAGAQIYIGQSGVGKSAVPAILDFTTANAGNAAYNLDTNSTGMLHINNMTTGPNFHNWIGSFNPGFIRIGGSGSYMGTNMAPGANNTYRLVGINSLSDAWTLDASGTSAGAVTGPNNVEIGFPGGTRVASVQFSDYMDYTGTTTVHRNSFLMGEGFGANTNAPVILNGGRLQLRWGGVMAKGDLSFQGSGILDAWNGNTFLFKSFNRVNYGALCMYDNADSLGGGGKIIVLDAPVPTNGMVTPYMVGTTNFLNYVAPNGFTNANFTQTSSGPNFPSGLSAGTDIVNVQGASTLQDDPNIHALRTAAALSANGANDTVTLGSGGLILNGGTYTHDVNWSCPGEMLVFVDSTSLGNAVTLSGTISASRLTLFGDGTFADNRYGFLKLTADNSATLTGPITLNKASVGIVTASTKFLGPANNDVVLNGGQLLNYYNPSTVGVTNPIKLGPLGGTLSIAAGGNWTDFYGPITDLVSGDGGPLTVSYIRLKGTNTFTGGLIIGGQMRFDAPQGATYSLGNGPVRVMENASLGFYDGSGTGGGNLTIPGRLTIEGPRGAIYYADDGILRVGSLEGTGLLQMGNGFAYGRAGLLVPSALIVGMDNTDSDFYGIIQSYWSAPPRSPNHIVKEGTGTLTLWYRVLTHGPLTVSNGTLRVNGTMEAPTNIVVKSGATLAGKGYIYSPVTVEAGGNLAESLTFATNVALGAGVNYNVALNGTNAVTQFGQMTVEGGTVTLSGTTLNLTLGYAPQVGQSYTILDLVGGAVSGQFACGQMVNALYNGRPYYFRVNYNDGNDIVLTAMPVSTRVSAQ